MTLRDILALPVEYIVDYFLGLEAFTAQRQRLSSVLYQASKRHDPLASAVMREHNRLLDDLEKMHEEKSKKE